MDKSEQEIPRVCDVLYNCLAQMFISPSKSTTIVLQFTHDKAGHKFTIVDQTEVDTKDIVAGIQLHNEQMTELERVTKDWLNSDPKTAFFMYVFSVLHIMCTVAHNSCIMRTAAHNSSIMCMFAISACVFMQYCTVHVVLAATCTQCTPFIIYVHCCT